MESFFFVPIALRAYGFDTVYGLMLLLLLLCTCL